MQKYLASLALLPIFALAGCQSQGEVEAYVPSSICEVSPDVISEVNAAFMSQSGGGVLPSSNSIVLAVNEARKYFPAAADLDLKSFNSRTGAFAEIFKTCIQPESYRGMKLYNCLTNPTDGYTLFYSDWNLPKWDSYYKSKGCSR